MPVPATLTPGSIGKVTRTITDDLVREFAALSGDTQPLHLDEAYAAQTRFGNRIAHGALLVGMVSAVLGVDMADGEATVIFLGLEISFTNPVFIGDQVTAQCEVTHVREDKPIVTLRVNASNQDGVEVMNGKAVVYIDPHPVAQVN